MSRVAGLACLRACTAPCSRASNGQAACMGGCGSRVSGLQGVSASVRPGAQHTHQCSPAALCSAELTQRACWRVDRSVAVHAARHGIRGGVRGGRQCSGQRFGGARILLAHETSPVDLRPTYPYSLVPHIAQLGFRQRRLLLVFRQLTHAPHLLRAFVVLGGPAGRAEGARAAVTLPSLVAPGGLGDQPAGSGSGKRAARWEATRTGGAWLSPHVSFALAFRFLRAAGRRGRAARAGRRSASWH